MGELKDGCTAKDIILKILATHARDEDTLDRSMEFGGPGLASLAADERATLCNMATECTAKTGIAEWDEKTHSVAQRTSTRLLTRKSFVKSVSYPTKAPTMMVVFTPSILPPLSPWLLIQEIQIKASLQTRPMVPILPTLVMLKLTSPTADLGTAGKVDDFCILRTSGSRSIGSREKRSPTT